MSGLSFPRGSGNIGKGLLGFFWPINTPYSICPAGITVLVSPFHPHVSSWLLNLVFAIQGAKLLRGAREKISLHALNTNSDFWRSWKPGVFRTENAPNKQMFTSSKSALSSSNPGFYCCC